MVHTSSSNVFVASFSLNSSPSLQHPLGGFSSGPGNGGGGRCSDGAGGRCCADGWGSTSGTRHLMLGLHKSKKRRWMITLWYKSKYKHQYLWIMRHLLYLMEASVPYPQYVVFIIHLIITAWWVGWSWNIGIPNSRGSANGCWWFTVPENPSKQRSLFSYWDY